MTSVPALVLPTSATLALHADGVTITHPGSIDLGSVPGARLHTVHAGGDLRVRIEATGVLSADGTITFDGPVDADRIEGTVVRIGPLPVRAGAIVASERIEVAPGTSMEVGLLSAPVLELEGDVVGQVAILDVVEASPNAAVKLGGALDVFAREQRHGDAVSLLAQHAVEPLAVRDGTYPSLDAMMADAPAPPLASPSVAAPSPVVTPAPRSETPVFTSKGPRDGSTHPPGFHGTMPPMEDPADEAVEDPRAQGFQHAGLAAPLAAADHDEDIFDDPSMELLASQGITAIDLDSDHDIETVESGAIEALPEEPPKKKGGRTRAKHHSQVRRAWSRIAESYAEDMPDALSSMGIAIDDNRTADVLRRLDEFWGATLRSHVDRRTPPPREVVRAFLALHGLR